MEIRTGTYYNYVPFVNEVMSFIAFHREYSEFYNRSFVKRYLNKGLIIQQNFECANDVDLAQKEEFGKLICNLLKIGRKLFESMIFT